MPARRLIAAVYVQDPETREDLVLLPGESPPPEIAALVTNPDAWDAPAYDATGPEPAAAGETDLGNTGGGTAKKPPSRRARPSPE